MHPLLLKVTCNAIKSLHTIDASYHKSQNKISLEFSKEEEMSLEGIPKKST